MKKEKTIKNKFYVKGMHCDSCEVFLESTLSSLPGVKKVSANSKNNVLLIESTKKLDPNDINLLLENSEYKITKSLNNKREPETNILKSISIALAFIVFFIILQKSGLVVFSTNENISLFSIFIIGLLASVSTCMAVVGGLILSISSNFAKSKKIKAIVFFHFSRFITFFILGGIIGAVGSNFILTIELSFFLSFVVFLIMLLMGLNLIGLNRNIFKFPKFFSKFLLNLGKKHDNFYSIILGFATFFLPCGFTQSMQIYALTQHSFLEGAMTMFVFALGTFPVLFLISFFSFKLATKLGKTFFQVAGFIILFFAIINLLGALSSIGLISPIIEF